MTARPQKITLAEMRSMGPSRLLIYCGNYKCLQSIVLDASQWSSHLRLSDLETRFVCQACGHCGVDVRPLFEHSHSRDPHPPAAHDASPGAETVIFPQPRRCTRFASSPPGYSIKFADSPGEQVMRNREEAEANADIDARIAQIEQMTLNQIAAFQCRMLTDIATGRIAPREAGAIDRALRKRLKAIEQELREGV